jgi:hypothetical protein
MATEKQNMLGDEVNDEIVYACAKITEDYIGYPTHVIVYSLLIYPINLLRMHAPNKEAATIYLEGIIKRQLEYLEERLKEDEK